MTQGCLHQGCRGAQWRCARTVRTLHQMHMHHREQPARRCRVKSCCGLREGHSGQGKSLFWSLNRALLHKVHMCLIKWLSRAQYTSPFFNVLSLTTIHSLARLVGRNEQIRGHLCTKSTALLAAHDRPAACCCMGSQTLAAPRTTYGGHASIRASRMHKTHSQAQLVGEAPER